MLSGCTSSGVEVAVPSAASAHALLGAARAAGVTDAALTVDIVAARNHGAVLRAERPD